MEASTQLRADTRAALSAIGTRRALRVEAALGRERTYCRRRGGSGFPLEALRP